MLGNLLMRLRHAAPDFPGRQRLLRACDRMLGPFVATAADGVRLRVFAASYMDALYFEPSAGAHSDTAILGREIARLGPGEVYVDVGANIGCHAIRAARQVGADGLVVGFEPSRREFTRLLANLELNGCGNVVPVSAALGETAGLLTLHVATTHTGLNTLRISGETAHAFRGAREERVPVLRLDDVLPPMLRGRHVKLLKIDVEGAEMQVLSGARALLRAGVIDTIVTEITPAFLQEFGNSKEELYRLLEASGYRPEFRSDQWQYDEVFVRPT